MFSDLVDRCTRFTLIALRKASDKAMYGLQTSGETTLVDVIRMTQLQKAISAVGMFSMFEALLQDGLSCRDGFKGAEALLDQAGETALKERFVDLQLAINVLKHGRGRSYDVLIARADRLPFRIKRIGDTFFCEGDVAEIATLIEVDDAFVVHCAFVIRQVSEAVRRARPDFYH